MVRRKVDPMLDFFYREVVHESAWYAYGTISLPIIDTKWFLMDLNLLVMDYSEPY